MLRAWVAWSLAPRILLSGALVAAAGLFMGMMLPVGIRLLSENDAELVPWGWGINGATSVIGTVGATVYAIHQGFNATLIVGGALYALAAASVLVLARLAKRTAQGKPMLLELGEAKAEINRSSTS